MPPRDEITYMMDDNNVNVNVLPTAPRSSSSRQRKEGSSSKGGPESSRVKSKSNKSGEKKKMKKKKSKQKKSSPSEQQDNDDIKHRHKARGGTGIQAPPPPPKAKEGVTVQTFMQKQQSLQNEASARKHHVTMRQRMLQEQCGMGNYDNGEAEEEEVHYFDEDNDSDNEHQAPASGAMVQRQGKNKAAKASNNNHSSSSHVVDALPADHPSSSTIQTHRTCTLCHRTLPRSQFSERDRFTINLSLSPGGVTCRTCAMTVSAVRLKSLPGTEALLLEYAQRGMERGMMAISAGAGGAPVVAGLLESGTNLNHSSDSNALVVRPTGKELTLYGAPHQDGLRNSTNSHLINNNNSTTRDIMGLQQQPSNRGDVNASFSTNQQRYNSTDADRPNSIADCKYIDALLRMPCYLNLNAFGVFTSSKEVSVSLAALEAVRLYGTVGGDYFVPHDCDGLPMNNNKSERSKGGSRRGDKGGKRHTQTPEQATAATGDGINNNNINPSSIVCLVLNEGPTPRTSILASQHYGWTTIAIDPKLDEQWMGYHDDIPNFMGYSGTINEFMDNNTSAGSNSEYSETMIEFRQSKVEHLVIIGVQQQHGNDTINTQENELRLKARGHVNEIRSRYDDVPTTLVSLSPVRKITLAPLQRRDGVCGSKLEKDVGYEPNCSYIDEGVFSACRMVEVWNFHNADEEGSDEDGSEYSDEEGGSYSSQSESEEEHTQRASSNKRSSKSKKETSNTSKKKSGIVKKSAWLEDQVAEYKKEKKDEEEAILYNDDDTLSTKGTFDRLHSTGSTIEGVVDRMPSHGDESVEDELARKEIHQRIQQRNNQEVPISDTEADPDSFIHGDEQGQGGHDDESNSNNEVESSWSQPDENEASKVWEKAMAKHGKEESFVNQFEEYYNKSDSGGSSDHNSGSQEQQGRSSNASPAAEEEEGDEPNTHGLPPGWEALYDEASGEYYYNNWETGEVTWEHPIGENAASVNNIQDNNNEEGVVPMSPLEEGGAEDHIHDSKPSYDSKPSAESSAAKSSYDGSNRGEKDDNVPPLCSYGHKHSNHTYSHDSFGNTSDTDSAYVFDDQSNASSGIAALSRWNKPQDQKNSPESTPKKTLGQSNQGSDEDDLIVWSGDENDNAEEEEVKKTLERTSSGASIKQQPWHKKDSSEGMLGGGNDDSFLYD